MTHIEDVPAEIDEAIAADDMDRLADVTFAVATSRDRHLRTYRSDVWDRLCDLAVHQRERLAGALLKAYESTREHHWTRYGPLELLARVCALPDSDSLVVARRELLEALGRQGTAWYWRWYAEMAEIEFAAGRTLPPAVVALIRRTAMDRFADKAFVALSKRLTEPILNAGEPWADRAVAELPTLPSVWGDLLAHATTATASKPSATWEAAGRALLDRIGPEAARETILSWLALVGRPRTLPLERLADGMDINDTYDPFNATALRGLAWLSSLLPPHPDTTRALGTLVETSLRKVAGIGPRNPKVANAGVVALSRIDGESALAEIARLATRVTYRGTVKLLEAALQARAEAGGLSREEIEELAVPAYGLTEVGRAVHEFGEAATAELLVRGTRTALTWRNGAGKVVKSVPRRRPRGISGGAQKPQGSRQGHRQDALRPGRTSGPAVPGPPPMDVRRLA